MEQDENTVETQDVTQESQSEVAEEATNEGETTQVVEPKDEGVKLSPAEFRHYKKWKEQTAQPSKAEPQPVSSQPNIEEVVLLANGMPEELLTELKAVAKARGITSLIKAQNDSIFVAVKDQFEKDKKQKDASLGASRGAGATKVKKDFATPGLSREDHRKMVLGQ